MKSKTDIEIINVTCDGRILCLPDGRLMGFRCGFDRATKEQDARVSYSGDHGRTWSEPEFLFKLPREFGLWVGFQAVLDHDGEAHLFMLNDAKTDALWGSLVHLGLISDKDSKPNYSDKPRLDIWHARTADVRKTWQPPHKIWEGYAGDILSVIQMRNGRILMPFCYINRERSWYTPRDGLDDWTYMGQASTTVLYSDDGGTTWQQGNPLKVFVPDITYALGAIEPAAIELKDGRVWMLIRSQMGRFYESFSSDGAVWSQPRPSALVSSDSPAGLCRLQDGRIALIWNNCLRYPYAYGGRQIMHAALSGDEGQTWRGYREVFRDPMRNQPPPKSGDYGTAYPWPVVAADGAILVNAGQGQGRRRLVRVNPNWLAATAQKWDGLQGVEMWSLFGTKGVDLEPHPQNPQCRVLGIRRADKEFPAAAVWNFPSGAKGRLRLRLCLRAGFKGCRIGLTDHFSVPYDDQDEFFNVLNLIVPASGGLPSGAILRPGAWHDLELRWNGPARRCALKLDGAAAGHVPLQRESRNVCYLRLASQKEVFEDGGFLVESVSVKVSK